MLIATMESKLRPRDLSAPTCQPHSTFPYNPIYSGRQP